MPEIALPQPTLPPGGGGGAPRSSPLGPPISVRAIAEALGDRDTRLDLRLPVPVALGGVAALQRYLVTFPGPHSAARDLAAACALQVAAALVQQHPELGGDLQRGFAEAGIAWTPEP